jgi:hypothetical protein
VGIKPNEETFQILLKKRTEKNFIDFIHVLESRIKVLESILRSCLENASKQGDLPLIKLLVEDLGIVPTESTLEIAALGNDESYNHLASRVLGDSSESISDLFDNILESKEDTEEDHDDLYQLLAHSEDKEEDLDEIFDNLVAQESPSV